MDPPKRASDALLALEGATQEAFREACASLDDGSTTEGPPGADKFVGKALSEVAVSPLFPARLALAGPYKPRGLDRLVLKSTIKPMMWDQPPMDVSISDSGKAKSIIDHWNPLNQRDTSVANMNDLYSVNLRIPVVALFEEYYIPFPGHMDKKSYQRVAEDGMHICSHDFDKTVELVCSEF